MELILYLQIKKEMADFHCCGRFPGGISLAASFAMLSPGSKVHANPLGVAASISISKDYSKYSACDRNSASYLILITKNSNILVIIKINLITKEPMHFY